LKASFAVVSESSLVLGHETSIIIRSVRQRFGVTAFRRPQKRPGSPLAAGPGRMWSILCPIAVYEALRETAFSPRRSQLDQHPRHKHRRKLGQKFAP
jgi:hypothetical protein